MSFIRWIPDATADMLSGNGEEQITRLGGKMQRHRDIQMRPNTREAKKVSQSQELIHANTTCKLRTCHFIPTSSHAIMLRTKFINGNRLVPLLRCFALQIPAEISNANLKTSQ